MEQSAATRRYKHDIAESKPQAMEVDPYNPKLFSNRCTAYLYLQDYEKALQDAKKCVSIDPDWYKGHVQLGSCYMGLKNYKEAINAYKKGRLETGV